MCVCVCIFCSVGIFSLVYNCVIQSAPLVCVCVCILFFRDILPGLQRVPLLCVCVCILFCRDILPGLQLCNQECPSCVFVCVFCSVGIFSLVYNCVIKSPPTRTQQRTRHGTHCHLGCPAVRPAHIPTVWCSTVLHGATCCAGMHCHYAGGRLC